MADSQSADTGSNPVGVIFEKERRRIMDEVIRDDMGNEVSPLSDDYEYWESQWENFHDPLSDDFQRDDI